MRTVDKCLREACIGKYNVHDVLLVVSQRECSCAGCHSHSREDFTCADSVVVGAVVP